jgi:hypothetical protein
LVALLAVCASPWLAAAGNAAPAAPQPDPTATAAATPAKVAQPVRSLRYRVDFALAASSQTTNYYGSNLDTGRVNNHTHGSIDASVLGFAPDMSLVVAVSESMDQRSAPAVTATVFKDGFWTYDPKYAANVNDEETALLSLLGRAIVADHDLGPGVTWTDVHNAPNLTDTATYVVDSLVGDDSVDLHVERAVTVTGPQPYDSVVKGSVRYNYKRSIPISAHLTERVHTHDNGQLATTDMWFDYALEHDSLSSS